MSVRYLFMGSALLPTLAFLGCTPSANPPVADDSGGVTGDESSETAADPSEDASSGSSATEDSASGESASDATSGADAGSTTQVSTSGEDDSETEDSGESETETEPPPGDGYSVLPNGRGGYNYEQAVPTIDRAASLAVFEETLYPLLQQNCSCHNSLGIGQAPLHADSDASLAHEYALTRVNFEHLDDSKFVVRMGIDRHNCFEDTCAASSAAMLEAVTAWRDGVASLLTPTPASVDGPVSEAEVIAWIDADRASVAAGDQEFIKYASLHEILASGASPAEMNNARAGLSKALNSTARWAPVIVNPVDINGKGVVYRFDTRDYWGYNKGITKLQFGGSDDDLTFGVAKLDYLGNPVDVNTIGTPTPFADEVSQDPEFARLIWGRILAGNVEGATDTGVLPPYVDGFKEKYIEGAQLVYTLTRPDVYNAIMVMPWMATELEDELGVFKGDGMDSYDYMITYQAITVDSRMYWRAHTEDGRYYWKTWDVFSGQLEGVNDIVEAYDQGQIRFPFWANPIPVFVSGQDPTTTPESLSFIATLAQAFGTVPEGCDPQPNFAGIDGFFNCRHFTGTGGLQQSASEIIFGLPNGLQAYMLTGAFNQRRVDAFVNIVRDPRILRNDSDFQLTRQTDFATTDRRLNNGSSCIGCHIDGMNRGDNNLRDWLDSGGPLPEGEYGVDSWIDDPEVVDRVKELYPPSKETRQRMEDDRLQFLAAMGEIKEGMMFGAHKSLYVEPTIWTIEWAQGFYQYPPTRSN